MLQAGDELKVLSRSDLGERIMATPALLGGKNYVCTERHIYAFGAVDRGRCAARPTRAGTTRARPLARQRSG